jgi:hypothetical protein
MSFRNKIEPLQYTPEKIQESLDKLVANGIAYIGADGRYRVREGIEVERLPDGTVIAKKRRPQ